LSGLDEASTATEALRGSLLRIDKSILSLVAARMNISDLLGEVKRREGLPVYDPGRELTVASLLAEEARRLGVSDELAREMYLLIARESRCRQLYCPQAIRVAVYGYGGMGRMLASLLSRAGCWVSVTGRSMEKAEEAAKSIGAKYMEPLEAIDWADMLIYAVPTNALESLLEEHARSYRESMLVADIASVKTPIARWVERNMNRDSSPDYVSLHPLFGPLPCPAGETIAVVPLRLSKWRGRLESLLAGLGLVPVYVTAEEHDKTMAINQVLHHLLYEVYARASRILAEELGVDVSLVKQLVTWSLKQTMSVASRLERLSGVVEEIRRLNPYTSRVYEAARRAIEEASRRS